MSDPKKALEGMSTAFDSLVPLDPEERERALRWLMETLDVSMSTNPRVEEPLDPPDPEGKKGGLSPKQFIAEKQPKTDVERITCLAFYLTHTRDTPQFKTQELTALNTEAAGHRFSNASQAAGNALNQNGYLAQAGGGRRQISVLGEKVVEALPDRDAVKTALTSSPKRRRRAAAKRSRSKAAK